MNDDLGDRMKVYEGIECDRRFMPRLPILARIDGRAFHSFTKGMNRPYDEKLHDMMVETTRYLVEHTNANIGYTQSDEITLAWHVTDPKTQVWFDGRITKMTSQLAAQATMQFNRLVFEKYMRYYNRKPTFDARVWQVPNLDEAANVFVWREQDATRNSISMAAQSVFSHKELQGKSGDQQQEMLFSKGINWNDYPDWFKRGTYVQKVITKRKFTTDEIANLPPKHAARSDPNLIVERTDFKILDMWPITQIWNRKDVLFLGVEPMVIINGVAKVARFVDES